MAVRAQDLHHIREIKLAGRVIGSYGVNVPPEQGSVETVNTGVDFANGALGLGGGLVFDDGLHTSIGAANDPAIGGGIVDFGGKYGSRGLARHVVPDQSGQGGLRE